MFLYDVAGSDSERYVKGGRTAALPFGLCRQENQYGELCPRGDRGEFLGGGDGRRVLT